MSKHSTETLLGPDPLTAVIRGRVREAIETIVEEELTSALQVRPAERSPVRQGYRHGHRRRTVGTSVGAVPVRVPRARVRSAQGALQEWRSTVLPRYQRRVRAVDAAILGVYLSGGNTRRVQAALRPLLRGVPLSKSTVSRIVARLKAQYAAWQRRDLGATPCVLLYLDALGVPIRRAGKVVRTPIQAVIGVRPTGEKVLLTLRLAGSESQASWQAVLDDLTARHLARPVLTVVDGCPGLRAALAATWPGLAVQRCTVHKLRNLLAAAPKHAQDAIREDYHAIVYAATTAAATAAYTAFRRKWGKRCPAVVRSLEEAGSELLTFLAFPASQWKALRTTNCIERLHEEFRRRVKTQSALPTEEAALVLLFGLLASGQIRMRRLTGYHDLPLVLTQHQQAVA